MVFFFTAEKKTPFFEQLKQIFGPSYFVKFPHSNDHFSSVFHVFVDLLHRVICFGVLARTFTRTLFVLVLSLYLTFASTLAVGSPLAYIYVNIYRQSY